MSEPNTRLYFFVWGNASVGEAVEEHGKGPLTISGAADDVEPFLGEAEGEAALDLAPCADAAVVHEHDAFVAEGVAVAVAEVAFGRGAHMGEDEGRGRFGSDAREVDAVPCGDCGGEYAGRGAE